ncbi:MAG TPA: inositol monophosphatase family protein [Candidatus Limnocylindrales bacterium]|nr:inositol monophosphatase family protein [Candidatus Limnocylindrales bacterium]
MTDDFLGQAEKVIMDILQQYKPRLISAYGNIEYDTKADATVVTRLDKELEEKLRPALQALDPGVGLLGEELGQTGSTHTYWTLDPIDGTEQFIRGIPSCKNLFSLVENGQPVWALMYMFARDELWIAKKGHGTFCNGAKVQMRHRPLERAWLDLSVNLMDPENLKKILNVRPHIAGYTIMRDSTLIINGRIDGALALKTEGGPWDYAPRALLMAEAGAKITNIGLSSYDFNDHNFLVAHPDNFDQIMRLIV